MVLITIKLDKKTGLGTLTRSGITYNCGGKPGFPYPPDTTLSQDYFVKKPLHESGEYVQRNKDGTTSPFPMKWSVLWIGQRGVWIHEMAQLPGSSGCIHLLPGDAKAFYDAVQPGDRIVFSWT